MYAVGRLGSYISRGVCTVSGPFHPFGGVVDIIVVEQPDGSFKSSPWYVKFGKFQGVLTREKVVNISVNEVEANFQMYMNHRGEAYFLREADGEEGESILHPSSSSDEMDEQFQRNMKPVKSKSFNGVTEPNTVNQIDGSNEKNLARTNSRRSRILGLVFGRRLMKEERFQDGEGCAGGVERASSMECAEIAADLLEANWSTNLATKKHGKEKTSRFSAHHISDGKADNDLQINDEETQVNSFMHDNIEDTLDYWALHNEIGSHNAEIHNTIHHSSIENEENSLEMSCMSTIEQVETSTVIQCGSVFGENCKVISEISRKTNIFGPGNSDHGEYVGVISDTNLKLPCTIEPEAYPGNQFDEQVVDERNVGSLRGCGFSEEVGTAKVQSFVCCKTFESLVVGLNGITEQHHEMLYLAGGGHQEFHVHAETVHAKDVLTSKDAGTEDIVLNVELTEVPEYQSHQPNLSHSYIHESIEADFGKPLSVPESYAQLVSVDLTVSSVKEVDSQAICNSCDSSTSSHEHQDEKNIKDENIMSGLQFSLEPIHDFEKCEGDSMLRKSLMLPPSGRPEEEQFFFGDCIEFKPNEVQTMKSVSLCCLEEGNHPSNILKTIKEVNGFVNTGLVSYSPSENFFQENQSTDPGNFIQKSRVISSPIFRSPNVAGEEDGQEAKSLPSMWSHIESLDIHDLYHPLRHSLDSNSKSLKWTLPIKDDSRYTKSNADEEDQLAEGQPNIDNRLVSVELEKAVCNPATGIGADYASQTSDTKKLDIDKCTSLDPAIVKNDRLDVGIGNHYKPCDAAKPIVPGTVSCESEVLFEPKMIAVDRIEKNPPVDPSKATVPSHESWRRWPFSFRRIRSRKAIQPTPDDVRIYQAEDDSERNVGINEGGKVVPSKRVKKMLRAINPTSKQLASLNLVEGRNIVTFTFSSSMLGKQQVDARIYLWKWNTRIVISDVDGTITKSDVLGQFMPLVGKDWSQTGVAHLFSAIKENGYQLLFLSARAISQAYLTRQFLLNLKQDGKALPDGPVVISPDGLFPSLFREVIRRAPHEFKITCLEDIKALFPSDCNPFYAGFGNRDTDEISYLKVGIPKGKIFTINPKGEIAVNRRVDSKSYTSLHALVNSMFPSMTSSSEQEEFNSWNYWKVRPLIIDI